MAVDAWQLAGDEWRPSGWYPNSTPQRELTAALGVRDRPSLEVVARVVGHPDASWASVKDYLNALTRKPKSHFGPDESGKHPLLRPTFSIPQIALFLKSQEKNLTALLYQSANSLSSPTKIQGALGLGTPDVELRRREQKARSAEAAAKVSHRHRHRHRHCHCHHRHPHRRGRTRPRTRGPRLRRRRRRRGRRGRGRRVRSRKADANRRGRKRRP